MPKKNIYQIRFYSMHFGEKNKYSATKYAYMYMSQQFCFNRSDCFSYFQKYEVFRQNVMDMSILFLF